MRASKIMQERVINTPNLEVHWNTETVEILGEDAVNGVKIRNVLTSSEQTLDVTGFLWRLDINPTQRYSKVGWTWMTINT